MLANNGESGRQNASEIRQWLRRYGRKHVLRSVADIGEVLQTMTAAMQEQGYARQEVFAVALAVQEALVNALHHGNGGDPAKQVRVNHLVTGEGVVAKVTDQGNGFAHDQVPDPRLEENREKGNGRGLLFMRSFMTRVWFNRRGNRVTLWKRRELAPLSAPPLPAPTLIARPDNFREKETCSPAAEIAHVS